MALEVASSILVARPTFYWGVAKWLRHRILIPAFVSSNLATPAISGTAEQGPLAQLVEHLIFNQGVPSSRLGWTTIYAPLAQLVEQMTLNHWAQGSSP